MNNTKGTRKHSKIAEFFIRLVKEKPLGTVGAIITLLLLLTGIFANYIAPYGMNEAHMADMLTPPSAKYWLGTDNMGRDILSRIIYGARVSMIVGLSASAISTFITVVIGTLCGYIGGKFDLLVQRIVDSFMCFPALILLMVVLSNIGAGIWQIVIVLGITWGIQASRIIRGAVISVKENIYVKAAESIGSSPLRILTKHILPNILAIIVIQFTVQVPGIIMTEASLSFLGFGIPPPNPSWGSMLSGTARSYMIKAPWMALWPGLALSLVVYGVSMFGDSMRDILDPRLRGGIGRYGAPRKKA